MPTALLSAYDKQDLAPFAQSLRALGWTLLASAGTAKYLKEQRIPTHDIAKFVGPPILGHKVVTLSREIHAALLADDSPEERIELAKIGIPKIDLGYVNLYPLVYAEVGDRKDRHWRSYATTLRRQGSPVRALYP